VAEADFSADRHVDFVDNPARVAADECSMSDNVSVLHPDGVHRPCNLCPHMKRITLKNIRRAETGGTRCRASGDRAGPVPSKGCWRYETEISALNKPPSSSAAPPER
jgi:hypothetical protein